MKTLSNFLLRQLAEDLSPVTVSFGLVCEEILGINAPMRTNEMVSNFPLIQGVNEKLS